MCGIFFASSNAVEISIKRLHRIEYFLAARGGDQLNSIQCGDAILVHSRLHLSGAVNSGLQPVELADGRLLAFNGEIYNYKNIAKKYHIAVDENTSDTDILAALIERRDLLSFVGELDGMFSILIYDPRDKLITLARDRFGQKPLYYKVTKGHPMGLEVSSLINCFDCNAIDKSSLVEYLVAGYVISDKSLFEGVSSVPSGCVLTFDNNLKINFFSYDDKILEPSRGAIDGALEESVISQINTNFPVCSALSGGVDSALISYFYNKNYHKADKLAVTISISDGRFDESANAIKLAKEIGLPIEVVSIDRAKIFNYLSESMRALSSPISDTANITSNFLYSWCKSSGYKAILSGSGGDELFSGYNRHKVHAYYRLLSSIGLRGPTHLALKLFKDVLLGLPVMSGDAERKISQLIDTFSTRKNLSEYYRDIVKIDDKFDCASFGILSAFEGAGNIHEIDRKYYLSKNNCFRDDQIGLFHSIEVRNPFLSTQIQAYAPSSFNIFSSGRKKILVDLRKKLFKSTVQQKKGFGFPVDLIIGDKNSRDEIIECIRFLRGYDINFEVDLKLYNPLRLYNLLCLGLWVKHARI